MEPAVQKPLCSCCNKPCVVGFIAGNIVTQAMP
jgi:hypothetical protein